jgi:hypothetical protein
VTQEKKLVSLAILWGAALIRTSFMLSQSHTGPATDGAKNSKRIFSIYSLLWIIHLCKEKKDCHRYEMEIKTAIIYYSVQLVSSAVSFKIICSLLKKL